MKLLLIIDHFGSGGAQRQMVELACGLKRRGHSVEMFVYHSEHDFFRPLLDKRGIVVHELRGGRRYSIGIVRRLAGLMRGGEFDLALSYLSAANVYSELARIAAPHMCLVVSERTSHMDDKFAAGAAMRRLLHLSADHVVANSQAQAAWLRRRPWLGERVSCIYNGVDLDAFQPLGSTPEPGQALRLLGVGRIGPEKNLVNLVSALARIEERGGRIPQVDWAGRRDSSPAGRRYCERIDSLLESLPAVRQNWHWLGLQTGVPQLLRGYHALIHPSLYEGLPNAVCEALAAGMPVLASSVCDHPLLVGDGSRGYLFDPHDPASIAEAIVKLSALDSDRWREFALSARGYASANLSLERMVESYEALFARLIAARTKQ